MATNTNKKTLSVMGLLVEVIELENAVTDENGRQLYDILVRGDEFDRIRAYNIQMAAEEAVKSVEKNFR